MAGAAHVEYVGFTARDAGREYALLVREASGTSRSFFLTISNEAFLSRRVRYQDAPEVCFLKLQRELVASPDGPPPSHLKVTDDDLAEYRAAHTPKPPQRRPKPPLRP